MNKKAEFYKYANYYLARLIKSAAPYRDNTVPEGSVLYNNIQARINDEINRNTYSVFHPYEPVSILDAVPQVDVQAELNKRDPIQRNQIKKRLNRDNRNIKKTIYKELQPRPGQPARDYQKAQTENYNTFVNDTISNLQKEMHNLDRKNRQVSDYNPTANNPLGTVGGGVYGVSLFGNYNKNFRDTNNFYKNIESERQALLPYVPEQQKNYVANIRTTAVTRDNMDDASGDYVPSRIRVLKYSKGAVPAGTMIHEGVHGLTATTKDTPVARKINTNVIYTPEGLPEYQWKNRLRNEFRSINATDRIWDELSKEAPAKQRKEYNKSSRSGEYKNVLYEKAGIDKRVPVDGYSKLPPATINRITNNIIRNRKINVNKILDVEPADKKWNNTYAQGFGKAYKENPELIDWLMEEKTKNYRLKPTATGKDRWNRASKKNKKSSILDNVEIALERNKDNADLLKWYKDNREDINYQYGVAKSFGRHERRAARKKLDRSAWEARRRSFGKTASYYPLLLHKYIYK